MGIKLRQAPWKMENHTSGASNNKHKRSSNDAPSEKAPGPKKAKTSAVQVKVTDMREAPIWAAESGSEEDF